MSKSYQIHFTSLSYQPYTCQMCSPCDERFLRYEFPIPRTYVGGIAFFRILLFFSILESLLNSPLSITADLIASSFWTIALILLITAMQRLNGHTFWNISAQHLHLDQSERGIVCPSGTYCDCTTRLPNCEFMCCGNSWIHTFTHQMKHMNIPAAA